MSVSNHFVTHGIFRSLAGLETQTQNATFFERKRPKRKPWPRGKSLNRTKNDRNAFFER